MTKNILKVVGVVAAFTMFVGVAVPSANALTSAEIEGLISALNLSDAQAAVLRTLATDSSSSTGNSAFCGPFSRSLTVGAQGADVTQLQTALESTGDLVIPVGVGKGYFGPLTQAALASYQAKNGIAPAAGYFGPITMSSFQSKCSAAPVVDNGGNTNTGSSNKLTGGAGSLKDVEFISSLNNEEVGEGQEDVEVAGIEIEADGSDIELTAVTLNFSYADTGADDELDEYADEVSLWFNGEEVARLDASEFEDDDNFQKTVALDSGAIIDENEKGDLVVAISGINNLDSTSVGEKWNVSFTSVRFRDAQDAIITDSSTGDIDDSANNDTTTDSDEIEFSFESFATANDVELKVSDGDDDINDARTIGVDDNSDTDGEEILSFYVEAEGGSDLFIDDLSVDFVSVGAGVGEIINAAEIIVDGDVLDSVNVSSTTATSRTLTFDNLGWTVDAGDKVEVIVRVDINDLDGQFTAGDTLSADVNPDDAAWDVEDEEGEDVAAADKTGSASSEAHSFFADGLNIVSNSVSNTYKDTNGDTTGGERGVYTVKFDVTAFGDAIYIPTGATIATSSVTADKGVAYTIEDSDGDAIALNGLAKASTTAAVSSTASQSGSYYVINDGETETFTLTVELTPLADGFFRAQLDAVNFNVGAAGSADTHQGANPQTDFETDYQNLDA